jgi:hypothetical protein
LLSRYLSSSLSIEPGSTFRTRIFSVCSNQCASTNTSLTHFLTYVLVCHFLTVAQFMQHGDMGALRGPHLGGGMHFPELSSKTAR